MDQACTDEARLNPVLLQNQSGTKRKERKKHTCGSQDKLRGEHTGSQLYMRVGWRWFRITEAEQETEAQTRTWKLQEARMGGLPGRRQTEITAFLDSVRSTEGYKQHVTDSTELQAALRHRNKKKRGAQGQHDPQDIVHKLQALFFRKPP